MPLVLFKVLVKGLGKLMADKVSFLAYTLNLPSVNHCRSFQESCGKLVRGLSYENLNGV